MSLRAVAIAMLALLSLCAAQTAAAQGVAKPPLNDNELKELLIWNSPWEGRSTSPPGLYSTGTSSASGAIRWSPK